MCRHIQHVTKIKSTKSNLTYKIIGDNCCITRNIIYVITCPVPNCRKQYIGESLRKAKDRIREHKADIRSNNRDRPVSKHYLEHGLQDSDLIATIIDSSAKNTNDRKRLEEAWIMTMETYQPHGMNLKLG